MKNRSICSKCCKMRLLKQFSTTVFNGNLLFWLLDGKLRNKSWIELIKAYWELWRKDEYSWTVKQSKTSSVARNLLHTAAKIDNSVRKYNFHYFKLSRFSKIKVIFYSTKKIQNIEISDKKWLFASVCLLPDAWK